MPKKRRPSGESTACRSRLTAAREDLARAGIDTYIVPTTDPHGSEYLCPAWQRRQWLSGFSGSAGEVIIRANFAGLWTDGRYHAQASSQTQGSGIRVFKSGLPGVPTVSEWLRKTLKKGAVVAIDAEVISYARARDLKKTVEALGATLRLELHNRIDRIWYDRPPRPATAIVTQPLRFAGRSARQKLLLLRKTMADAACTTYVVSALDEIAWLFNLRGHDIPFNPVALAYAIVGVDDAQLFCQRDQLSAKALREIAKVSKVLPYDRFYQTLAKMKSGKVFLDPQRTNMAVIEKLKGKCLHFRASPLARLKAAKNTQELGGIRQAHHRDGLAMVRFLRWLAVEVPKGQVDECSAARKLRDFRSIGDHFRGESFPTIAGYGPNGAIIHYSAQQGSQATLRSRSLFLIDSGGHYLDGTTDITRTVLLCSRPPGKSAEHYTRVLKGHIALARCRFPRGTTGSQLDALARYPLWQAGLDYPHGTGHGVGAYLNVHEGPPAIHHGRSLHVPLEPGHVLSNEPGYYVEGEYGIRIENLMVVVEDKNQRSGPRPFLHFETLSLCPIETRLIRRVLLDSEEIDWLNSYHRRVRRCLAPYLDDADRKWLVQATKPIR